MNAKYPGKIRHLIVNSGGPNGIPGIALPVIYCLVFTFLLLNPVSNPVSIALAAAPAAEDATKEVIKSFLEYRPDPAAFQPEIRPLVEQVVKGTSIERPASETSATSHVNPGQEQLEKALKTGEALLQKLSRGYHDEIHFLLGLTYQGLGEERKALQEYSAALKLRSGYVLPLYFHAKILKDGGKCGAALPEFKELHWRTDAAEFEILYLLAECEIAMRNPAAAVKYLDLSYTKNPNYPPTAKLLLSTRMELLGRTTDPIQQAQMEQQTVSYLTKLTEKNPNDRDATIELVRLLTKSSDPLIDAEKLQRAQTLAQNLVTSTDYSDDEAVRTLFDTQIKRKDLVGAGKTLAAGLKKKPNSKELKEAIKQLEMEKTIQS